MHKPMDIGKDTLKKREENVIKIVEDFSKKPEKLINNISVENLIDKGGINPYLLKSLGIKTIEEAVEFFLMRRVERSLGTSFGTVLEKFIRELLGGKNGRDLHSDCKKKGLKEKPWICWWDVVTEDPFNDGEKKWKGTVISVKSGPADMDKDQVEHFSDRALDAEEKSYRPYLALVYGKEAWSVIPQTLKNKGLDPDKYLRIGKQIFEEFIDDSNYCTEALKLFSQGGLKEDLFDMIERKKEKISGELKKKYGTDLDKLLEDTF